MSDFLLFMDELVKRFPLHVKITYNKTTDWVIYVYKKNCADDYPNSPKDGEDACVCLVQACDMELAFAKAHVDVKEWLLENEGGY